ncbi:MAG: PRC-barrel domain-containing protein [Nocardioides sp.]
MTTQQVGLVTLRDSDLLLVDESDDVRGMRVLDPNGHRVGQVDEIVVDEQERRARLLVVTSGGILGMAEDKRLVPVEAVARVDEEVHLHHTHHDVQHGAGFDPALQDQRDYTGAFDYYGYVPFWHTGYITPYFHHR